MADGVTMDKVNIEIESNSSKAGSKLDILANTIKKLKGATSEGTKGLDKFGNSMKLLRVGATVAAISRLAKTIKGFIDTSSKYISSMNYFNTTMGEMKDTATDFINTMSKEFYLDPSNLMNYMASFNSLIKGFGLADEEAYKMSKNLTQLSYDLAAFKGLSIEDAMQKIKSGISGELEPMRAIGVALDQATLQETAYELGIKKRVSTMTRAQKTELLYYQMMKSTTQAQNYFANTLAKTTTELDGSTRLILNPATALSLLKQQFSQLGRAVGNIFIPILTKMIPYIMAATQVLKELANSIAAAFGFKLSDYDFSKSLGNTSAGIKNVGSEADKTAKKVKGMLAPFDELNTIDFGNNNGGNTGISGGGSLGLPEQNYDWLKNDALTKKVEEIKNKFQDILPIVKTIGAALLTWTIGSKLINFFDSIGLLTSKQKSLKALFGLTLIVASIGIAASAVKDLKDGKITGGLLKSLASGLGVGIAASIMGLSLSVSALLGITVASVVFMYGAQQLGKNTWQGVLIENSNLPKQLKFNLQLAVGISKIVWSGLEKILPEKQLKQLMEKMILNIASFLENIPVIGESIANAIRAGVAASKTEIGETIKYTSEEALKQANPWVKTKSEQLGRSSITAYNSGISSSQTNITSAFNTTTTKAIDGSQPVIDERIKRLAKGSNNVLTTNIDGTTAGKKVITSLKSGTENKEVNKNLNDRLKMIASSSNSTLNTNINANPAGRKAIQSLEAGTKDKNAIKNLNSRLSTVGSDVKTELSKKTNTTSVGTNIISGINSGMKNSTGKKATIWSTIGSIASSIVSTFTKKLGIHSPSTVMRDYVGKFIPLGISEGISNEAKSVYNSINELTNGLVDIGKANISSVVGVTYDDISGNIQSQTEVISNISSSDFANKVGQYCYNAITQGFNDNPQNVNVNIGNEKVYSGYGRYQTRQANKYGVSTVTI